MSIGLRLSKRPSRPPDPIGAATFGFLAGIVATVALILTLRSNNSQSKALAVSTPELEAAAAETLPLETAAKARDSVHAAIAQEPLDPDLEAAKWRIRVGVLEYIEQNAGLWIGKPETKPRADGRIDVVVPISWNIDPEPVIAILNEYFRAIGTRPSRHGLVYYRSAPKARYSNSLFDWLTTQRLTVRVKVASNIQTITLAAGRRCVGSVCRAWGRDRYQIHFAHESGDPALIAAEPGGDREPLVFRGVPADVLETHGVDATVMIESVHDRDRTRERDRIP